MQANRVLVPPAVAARQLTSPHGGELIAMIGRSMGTTWTVQAIPPDQGYELHALVESALHDVITQMSTWQSSSHLSRFNAAAPNTWHALPSECFEVLSYALSLAQATQGAYDPTIGALVNVWGFGPAGPRHALPDSHEIESARKQSGWQRVALSSAERRAHQPGGVEIDLSSIAKGFAVDHVARALASIGIENHLVEIGGELRGTGCKPDGSPWWVEIEHPNGKRASRTLVALHELSIATSGDYRRYMERAGKRYSHAIDPRTGWPVHNDLASVTVLARECMHADAFATALHILGLEHGMEFARAHDIAAVFGQRVGTRIAHHLSPATQAYLD